ncbi:YigZ family protein [Alkalicoccus halolimnae]|uniref:YigZ family protein n=1 Tax=Alkalicoccus halolimnae TaxID=1667239 RepID=A0A5C7FH60_9BACI|nr:YigZ family protein [Alkalicoccus halolimnae]TXF85624.1 YigZ family protein [Alkalicoccus halolimnae]
MLSTYFTVKPYGESEIIIQKSRFLVYVKRVTSEEEARTFIAEIKNNHLDASHNCSAYMIGEHDLIQKANDDGEPSGTAGVPMLEVLKQRKLKDTCIVVTRYFGGIKLGGGGLIRAYGSAASAGIQAAGVVERRLTSLCSAIFDYSHLGKIENEVRSSPYKLYNISYEEKVTVTCYVEAGFEENFEQWMQNLTNGQAKLTRDGTAYLETDIKSSGSERF